MGKQRALSLTAPEHTALVSLRDHAPKAYLRERAAALLKVAAGQPAAEVARSGLLRPRAADTLYAWLTRFEAAGLTGLQIKPGRGRKPAFSPCAPDRNGGAGRAAARRAPRAPRVRDPGHPLDAGDAARRL